MVVIDVQVLPDVASANVIVEPVHTELGPVIGATVGVVLTVKFVALVPYKSTFVNNKMHQ